MTTPLLPPYYVEPPPPPATSYGLFSVAVGPMDMPNDHAIGGGVEYIPNWCTDDRLFQSVCDPTPQVKVFDPMDAKATAPPLQVYASLVCGSQTFTFDEMGRRVLSRFAAGEQSAVESMLWGVAAGDTPGYFQTAAVPGGAVNVLAGVSTSVVAGVSALEAQLAVCYGHPGILHVTPAAAAYLADRKQLFKDGAIWRTQRGNAVSIGDGYSGLSAAGAAAGAGNVWMFITGRVLIWRSADINVPDPRQTLNRTTNQHNLIAERDYALLAECCVTAKEVTLA